MIESLLSGLPNLRLREKIRDDDSIDQLHHFVTVYIFIGVAVLVGIKEFYGVPLDCWNKAPAWQHFQAHANYYCWAHRLYEFPNPANRSQVPYLLNNDGGPLNPRVLDQPDQIGELNFFRWITVVFILQAFLFKLPNMIWIETNESSGTQIEKIVELITNNSFESREKKDSVFSGVAEFMERWLIINRKPFWFMKSRVGLQTKKTLQHCMLCVGANSGNYMSTLYLVVKTLFLVNVLIQFGILSVFLETNYWTYGPDAIEDYHASMYRVDRPHFPRVALCHFQVKGQGQWIQCLMTINMLLEKIFIIEWFWLLILLVLTAYSFVSWLLKILRTEQSVKFVRKYLSVLNEDGTVPEKFENMKGEHTISHFVSNYLGNDGVFFLRILATNSNDVSMSELVGKIWVRYCKFRYAAKEPVKNSGSADLEMDEFVLDPAKEKGTNKGAGDQARNLLMEKDAHHIA